MNRREDVAETVACGLAAEVVRTFGTVCLRVLGTSMVPSILPGDLISVQRVGVSEVSKGEIVLWSREGRLFAHRVVACAGSLEKPLLITRGDRIRHNDPPVSPNQLLGRVTSIQSNGIERGDQKTESLAQASGPREALVRLLQASDRTTYLYLRLAAISRALFHRRAKCRA